MQEIIEYLNAIKWTTVDNVVAELTSNECSDIKFINFLKLILEKEVNYITKRRNEISLKVASFPSIKTIDEFHFYFQPSVINQNLIMELCTLNFIDNKQNIIFVGNPGVGKTHLSIGLGVKAIQGKRSTYFLHYSKLMFELKKAKERNMLEERLKNFANYKVLIIDEIGYLPLNKESGDMFFQLVNKFYEKKSLIITTNKPFNEWVNFLEMIWLHLRF